MNRVDQLVNKIVQDKVRRRRATALWLALSMIVTGTVSWSLRDVGNTLTKDASPGAAHQLGVDPESEADWESSLPELSENWRENMVAIAQSQLGYSEGKYNCTISDDETELMHYTRYGAWYGNPYGEWNSMFTLFCMHYSGVPESYIPYNSGCWSWSVQLAEKGYFLSPDEYSAYSGDLIFFDTDDDGRSDRVGVITNITGSDENALMSVIEGDCDGVVAENKYPISDPQIAGYVSLKQPEYIFNGTSESGIKVHVAAEEGAFPNGTTMIVTDVPDETAIDAISGEFEDESDVMGAVAVDVTFYDKDGCEIEPADGSKVHVSITLPKDKQIEGENFQLFHQKDDGEVENISEADVAGDGATFQAESFSKYVITGVSLNASLKTATAVTTRPRISITAPYAETGNAHYNIENAYVIQVGESVTIVGDAGSGKNEASFLCSDCSSTGSYYGASNYFDFSQTNNNGVVTATFTTKSVGYIAINLTENGNGGSEIEPFFIRVVPAISDSDKFNLIQGATKVNYSGYKTSTPYNLNAYPVNPNGSYVFEAYTTKYTYGTYSAGQSYAMKTAEDGKGFEIKTFGRIEGCDAEWKANEWNNNNDEWLANWSDKYGTAGTNQYQLMDNGWLKITKTITTKDVSNAHNYYRVMFYNDNSYSEDSFFIDVQPDVTPSTVYSVRFKQGDSWGEWIPNNFTKDEPLYVNIGQTIQIRRNNSTDRFSLTTNNDLKDNTGNNTGEVRLNPQGTDNPNADGGYTRNFLAEHTGYSPTETINGEALHIWVNPEPTVINVYTSLGWKDQDRIHEGMGGSSGDVDNGKYYSNGSSAEHYYILTSSEWVYLNVEGLNGTWSLSPTGTAIKNISENKQAQIGGKTCYQIIIPDTLIDNSGNVVHNTTYRADYKINDTIIDTFFFRVTDTPQMYSYFNSNDHVYYYDHSDIEIDDGGTYTITSVEKRDGQTVRVKKVYSVDIQQVNRCDIYNNKNCDPGQLTWYNYMTNQNGRLASGSMEGNSYAPYSITHNHGNKVENVSYDKTLYCSTCGVTYTNPNGWTNDSSRRQPVYFLTQDYAHIGNPGETQYEYTSKYHDGANKNITKSNMMGFETSRIHFDVDEVKSVKFNVKVKLKDGKEYIYDEYDEAYSNPLNDGTPIDDQDITNVNFELYRQSIIDANNKCPDHSGLDFTVRQSFALIQAKKNLIGRQLTDKEFTFGLYEGDTLISEAKNDSDGNIYFDAIIYDSEGTHNYTIKEKPGSAGDIIFDSDPKVITVKVTKNSNGDLISEVYYPDEKEFVNYLTFELPSTGGNGTTIIFTSGAALMLTAGIMYKRRRKEDE